MLIALLAITAPATAPTVLAEKTRYEQSQPHMGTIFRVVLYSDDAQIATQAIESAFRRIGELDSALSDYKPDSELSQLNLAAGGPARAVGNDLWNVLLAADEISRLSDGAFDVTVGPLVELWRRARKSRKLPNQMDLETARLLVGYRQLVFDRDAKTVALRRPGMKLDLGGIAKGYACDAALAVIRSRGISQAMVIGGGDIALGDPPPGRPGWRVAVLDNVVRNRPHTRVLANVGVSTSGDAEQFVEIDGKRYSHIVDPKTGLGLTNQIQATIIAPSCTRSDALASAVCVLGIEKGLALVDTLDGCSMLAISNRESAAEPVRSRRWRDDQ